MPVIEESDWDDLDLSEEQVRFFASVIEAMGGDNTELLKAWRMVEKRRADLLGERELGGRGKTVTRALEFDASPMTVARWRKLRDNWEWLLPILLEATKPAEVSQSRLLKLIKQRHVLEPAGPLPQGVYSTVVIDPPWQYDNRGTRGAAADHYPTMNFEELRALEVPAADKAHLYLWTTNAFLRAAFDLVEAWGFEYKGTLVWAKGHHERVPQMGMGNYFRVSHEIVLFGVRGGLELRRRDAVSWFVAPRGEHSAKPDAFYELVESCSPGPYLDMFNRDGGKLFRRSGWDGWGNEA